MSSDSKVSKCLYSELPSPKTLFSVCLPSGESKAPTVLEADLWAETKSSKLVGFVAEEPECRLRLLSQARVNIFCKHFGEVIGKRASESAVSSGVDLLFNKQSGLSDFTVASGVGG